MISSRTIHILALAVFPCAWSGCAARLKAPPAPEAATPQASAPAVPTRIAGGSHSIDLVRQFLEHNQKPDGYFVTAYDFSSHRSSTSDDAIEQAGTLWGLAMLDRDQPTSTAARALDGAARFFLSNSRRVAGRGLIPYHKARAKEETAIAAMLVLAHIERLESTCGVLHRANAQADFDGYLEFLVTLRRRDGRFHPGYARQSYRGEGIPSPRHDGAGLLALVRAARFTGRSDLHRLAMESSRAMRREYVEGAPSHASGDERMRDFAPWALLAWHAIAASGWEGAADCERWGLDLARKMTAAPVPPEDALEDWLRWGGAMVCALDLARRAGDAAVAAALQARIEQGLAEIGRASCRERV